MKDLIKDALERTGYRVVNSNRRWGINFLDDVSRILPGRDSVQIVFDVGANYGQTAIAIHRRFSNADIYSFEPVSATFAVLQQKTQHIPKVHPKNCALGAKEGELEITLYGDAGKSSFLQQLHDSHRGEARSTEVTPVTTADLFTKQEGIQRIDLLKTDTEGFDIEVLHGAQQTLSEHRIQLVYSEFHHFFPPKFNGKGDHLGNLADIHAFLSGFGYELLTVYTDSVSPTDNLGTYNALFAAPNLKKVWRS